MAKFILADENMEANSDGSNPLNFAGKNLGKCVFVAGANQKNYVMNPTTKSGGIAGILTGSFFEAGKDGWTIKKGAESFYCPISFVSFYRNTQEKKEMLYNKIREGLKIIKTDIEEFNQLDDKISKYNAQINQLNNLKSANESAKKQAELYFKHMFINEIDYFSGSIQKEEGKASLVSMQKKSFPTIIDDFLSLNKASELETNSYLNNIPTVEKNLLKSKLTAYNEWMQIYQSTLKSRLDQYGQIKRSKEFVINQTKESLKPHITQYKLFKDALSSAGKLKNEVSFFMKQIGSQEPFESFMVNYLVKGLTDPHQTMAPNQFVREAEMDGAYGKYGCYDKFMREELVFNFDHGLICDFPWITEEWVEKEVKAITSAGYWKKNKLYFNFFKLQSNKTITELPLGNGNAIMEDADIIASMFVMSRNVMAAKMLELAAKEEEAVLYVDKMLGLVPKVNGRKIIKYETKGFNYVVGGNVYDSKAKLLETFPKDKFNLVRHKKPSKLIESIKDMFFINFDFRVPGGPYEHQFHRSLNKIFLKGPVIQRYNGLCGLILKRMNIEGPITPLQSEGMKIFQDQINRDQ